MLSSYLSFYDSVPSSLTKHRPTFKVRPCQTQSLLNYCSDRSGASRQHLRQPVLPLNEVHERHGSPSRSRREAVHSHARHPSRGGARGEHDSDREERLAFGESLCCAHGSRGSC